MTDLRSRLDNVADLAGDGLSPPESDFFAHRKDQRRRTALALAAIVLVIGASSVALAIRGTSSRPIAQTSPIDAPRPPGRVTIAHLETYHWSKLPGAPLLPREGTIGVWTGTHMILWGGVSSYGQPYADGASYDPNTRTWKHIANAPLTGRRDVAYAWTGHDVFVWGGQDDNGDASPPDGALYDPTTDIWRRLPPLDPGPHDESAAVWTGSQVVLFTTGPWATSKTVTVHAYTPATDTWTPLASVHINQTNLVDLYPLAAGNALYLWLPVQTLSHGGLQTGNVGFVYRPESHLWARTAIVPAPSSYSVGQPLWTGDHIIFSPNGVECSCAGVAGSSTGSWADPRTGQVQAIPPVRRPPQGAPFLAWSGAAVIASSNSRTAAWDPGANTWTTVARPAPAYGNVTLWTGTEILICDDDSGCYEFGP
jgi:hypothetical protein